MEDLKEKYLKKIDDISSKAKQDIDEVIKAYEEELNSLDGDHWIPAEEEKYWWVDEEGCVEWTEWHGWTDEEARLLIGNIFKTEEEAVFEVERLKILAIMKKYSKPFVGGYCNYTIEFDYNRDRICTDSFFYYDYGIPYFESEEIAQKVINEIGEDRLKKYYFRVE
ncbi:hypothetical protein PN296_04385 [Peptostreptococcus anaerobius]|uniref:hypothetical protein n=1 Tax=Peptostreptococcus TaxID=1257 RepID=UPI00232CB057|nr:MULTISPECIES: hypothetical protein [Peptostreptococcus]MDB8821402.1 hypothetical protein [Peptostreptococcus anaerobius]MDB8825952.1 hypothetical protein [Peptostreptococcus anaerobius]MDB8827887.1 hypothetical protein [Peptostreptococcus anaerobius]MDB8829705.1 hypothetical protein [Peptostreptococcus anaerobius]MDB8831567.1 hypothetical protein [Peptostreptococcus anaerobius]